MSMTCSLLREETTKTKNTQCSWPPTAVLSPSLSEVDIWLQFLSSVSWWPLGLAVTLQDSLVSTSIKNFPSDLKNHTHTRTWSSAWGRFHHVGSFSRLWKLVVFFSQISSFHFVNLVEEEVMTGGEGCWLVKQKKRKGKFADPELMIYFGGTGVSCVLCSYF